MKVEDDKGRQIGRRGMGGKPKVEGGEEEGWEEEVGWEKEEGGNRGEEKSKRKVMEDVNQHHAI